MQSINQKRAMFCSFQKKNFKMFQKFQLADVQETTMILGQKCGATLRVMDK